MLLGCSSHRLQSIWRRRCPSSHSHPGRMRLKCAGESALLAGKDETFITAAKQGPEPERGAEGVEGGGTSTGTPAGEFRC